QAAELLDELGMIGESTAINDVRESVLALRGLNTPVLISGETGSGKELVAQAIHQTSERRGGPYYSAKMAALSPEVASSQLFGHAGGAGLFTLATGGTLFLDEIGEAPLDVQLMLHRALETGRILPVGASSEQQIDVRLITATDRDLEKAILQER